MKKHVCLVTMFALLFAMRATPFWGQTTGTVQGAVKDQNGKPLEGVTVELSDPTTGRKYTLKTNAKGEYSSIGIAPGTYDIALLKDGKEVDKVTRVPVAPGGEVKVPDLSTKSPAATTEEQKKAIEEVQKHNEKIKTLNASLSQAKQLEAAGNYDEAVSILTQATQVDANQDIVWFSLGDAQRGAKKYTDAIDSYQKAIAIKGTVGGAAEVGADLGQVARRAANGILVAAREIGANAEEVAKVTINGAVEAAGSIGNTAVKTVKDVLVNAVGGVKEIAGTVLPKGAPNR